MWEKTNYQREYMALSEYIAETSSIRVEAIEGEVQMAEVKFTAAGSFFLLRGYYSEHAYMNVSTK